MGAACVFTTAGCQKEVRYACAEEESREGCIGKVGRHAGSRARAGGIMKPAKIPASKKALATEIGRISNKGFF